MKNFDQSLFLLLLLFFINNSCYSQSKTTLDRVSNSVNVFYKYFPQEKVYLQLNKYNFSQYENVWFKAYVTSDNKLSEISKILYVEIIDSNGLIKKRLTLPLKDGCGSGNIYFSSEFSSGAYYIRAYTEWMMNFDNGFFYLNKINVDNTDTNSVVNTVKDYNIQFFPEGGPLVNGLVSHIVFKSTDQSGNPVKVKGKLIDSSGKIISNLSTKYDGVGDFMIYASHSLNKCQAIVTTESGVQKKFSLPDLKSEGVVLYVKNDFDSSGNHIFFRVSRSVENKDNYANLLLCSQVNDHVEFDELNFDSTNAGNYNDTLLSVPSQLALDSFPSGLLHISLFNEQDGKLLAERLTYYNNGSDKLNMITDTAKIDFGAGSADSFQIYMPVKMKGNLSVSILENNDNLSADTKNIRTYLFVNSEFDNSDPDLSLISSENFFNEDRHVDLVLITKKWTRFDWSKILKDTFPKIRYIPHQSLFLDGKAFVVKKEKKEILKNSELIMMEKTKDSTTTLWKVPTDSIGNFSISDLNFYDTAFFYVQNTDKKNRIVIEPDKKSVDSITYVLLDKNKFELGKNNFVINQNYQKDAAKTKSIHALLTMPDTSGLTLKSVTVKARQITHTDSTILHYSDGAFAQTDAQTFDFTNNDSVRNDYRNVLQFLQTNVPGLIVSGNTGAASGTDDPIVYWRPVLSLLPGLSMAERFLQNAPDFFLNEQLLNQGADGYHQAITTITSLRVQDIAMIRSYQPGTFPGVAHNAPNGVIAIWLKDGSEGLYGPSTFDKITQVGYTATQNFDSTNNSYNVVYWNPDLVINGNIMNLEFQTKPVTKKITVQIEGIEDNGKIISYTNNFILDTRGTSLK